MFNIYHKGTTEIESIGSLTLYAAQNNVDIILLGKSTRAFHNTAALAFNLICDSPLDNLVINSLSMTAEGNNAFDNNVIIINNDIRDIVMIGETLSVSGFDLITININATILHNAIFTSDGNYDCFSQATIIINKINGNLEMINNGARGLAFYDSSVTVTNGVDGNVLLHDRSTAEGQAFRISDITIGNIGGYLSVRSDATTSNSFSGTHFQFGNILGNVEFIDNATAGPSYVSTFFDIGFIGGDLLFAALIDNGQQAFDLLVVNIGTVNGNIYFICNTYGGFSEGAINIDAIQGIAMFNGSASGGYEYYSTDFNIKNASYILFYTNSPVLSFFDSHNTFGSGVDTIEIIVDSITDELGNTLESSEWDCRNCNEISIRCFNYGDCGTVKVYCPENNQQDTCEVHCDGNSECKDINLYTTNGYCSDARFYCHDNNCDFLGGDVFCTFGTSTVAYGLSLFTCSIIKNDDDWICTNIGASNCVNTCTERPTINPTKQPTELTYSPTFTPTINPTFTHNPTISPTTINPTVDPTDGPTYYPVFHPTYDPTTIPTSLPSNNPAYKTTMSPSQIPSPLPTVSPVKDGNVGFDTTFEGTHSKEEREAQLENVTSLDWLLPVIIGVTLIIVCVIALLFYWKRRQKHTTDNVTGIEVEKVHSVEVMSETEMGEIEHKATDMNATGVGMGDIDNGGIDGHINDDKSETDEDTEQMFVQQETKGKIAQTQGEIIETPTVKDEGGNELCETPMTPTDQ